ncbi:MAG: XRE family transcriptional regulator [Myxococcota bacterium]|jgi:Zn-dependent peptidase ImmA (M78 family)/DNA-binding XRE family transcriptional regulator|nr:XRE family transcriptional regulator [Myxococcota bacterium]
MDNNTIAINLRRLRSTKEFSQESVAEKAGLSRAAYCNIENGKSAPRVSTLQAIARALGVRVQALVEPTRELTAVRFRSNKRLRSREQILVDAARWLADFNDIEEVLDDGVASKHSPLLSRMRLPLEPEKAAAKLREAFGIQPDDPIRDICGLLEAHGIKVGTMSIASHDFFGLSVASSDGGPAIIVNTWERISVERWIFTAAHELGHLILHLADYEIRETEESDDHENQANAFAAAFLMPAGAFQKEWDETYGLPLIDRVLKVKRIFRVSYRTVLHRLSADGVVKGNVWARFQMDYQRRNGRTLLRDDEPEALAKDAFQAGFPENLAAAEPEHLSRFDFPGDRLSRLVRRAIEEQKISLGRGAEILGRSLDEMRELSTSWVG